MVVGGEREQEDEEDVEGEEAGPDLGICINFTSDNNMSFTKFLVVFPLKREKSLTAWWL